MLQASCPGYYPFAMPLAGHIRQGQWYPKLGKVTLRPLGGGYGHTVSITTLAAPKKARKHFEKGLKLLSGLDPNPKKAAKEFEKAIAEHPTYAAAWSMLGKTRLRLKDPVAARIAFEQAVKADPMYLGPYKQLTVMALNSNEWSLASELTDRAVRLNPVDDELKFHNAIANYAVGQYAKALQSTLAIERTGALEQLQKKFRFRESRILAALAAEARADYRSAARLYGGFLLTAKESAFRSTVQRSLRDARLKAATLDPLSPVGLSAPPSDQTASAPALKPPRKPTAAAGALSIPLQP